MCWAKRAHHHQCPTQRPHSTGTGPPSHWHEIPDLSIGSCQQPVWRKVLHNSCPANTDTAGPAHPCQTHASLPHTCCKQRGGKEHSEPGQDPSDSCCIQHQHPPSPGSRSWQGHMHRVLGTLHPSRGTVTAPQHPKFQPFFFWHHHFPPSSLPPTREKGQICQLLCGEFSFFRTKCRRHRSSHTAVSSLYTHSLLPGPLPQGATTNVLQHQNSTKLLPLVPKRALTCPPTLPQDQANWQHTSITRSSSCGRLSIPNEWAQSTPRQTGEHPELRLW